MLGHLGLAFLALCDKITRHICEVCNVSLCCARMPLYNVCTTYVQRSIQRWTTNLITLQIMFNLFTT